MTTSSVRASVFARLRAAGAFDDDDDTWVDAAADEDARATPREDDDDVDDGLNVIRASFRRLPSRRARRVDAFHDDDASRVLFFALTFWRERTRVGGRARGEVGG